MEEKLCVSCEEPVIDKQPACPLACMSPKCKAYQDNTKVKLNHRPVIWILGGPGAGKTTQCDNIVKKYGFTHISTGDLVRAEAASTSDRARCLTHVLARGGLVPSDIVLGIIKDVMLQTSSTATGYIIDGYPRDKGQGLAFEKAIGSPTIILYFEVSSATLLKRLMELSRKHGRIDDTEEAINMRLQNFLFHVQEIISQYTLKLSKINADASPDEVFASVQKVLDPIAAKAKAAIPATVPQLSKSVTLP